jgi:hypothetical protein
MPGVLVVMVQQQHTFSLTSQVLAATVGLDNSSMFMCIGLGVLDQCFGCLY